MEAHDLKSLGIILSKYWWVENLKYRGSRPVDMNSPEMQAILHVATNVGPNQYKVKWRDFSLMIYPPQGKVIFHATSAFVMNAGLSFIQFMTNKSTDTPPGPALTRQQALSFAAKLRMFYSEEETRILGDSNHLLPEKKERMFEVIFKPDDPMQKKLLNIFIDFSKGGEWVHQGDPGLGGGLAEAIRDPLKAVGVLAEVVAFCNSVGQSFNELNIAAGEGLDKANRITQQLATEQARVARAQQYLSTDITTLMGQVPEDLGVRLDLIQGSLNALATAIAQPQVNQAETNNLLRELIDATRDGQADIRQSVTRIDEEQAERLNDLATITTETRDLLEHHHQDAVLRDNARAIQTERVVQALERYHRGVIRNEQYVAKKMRSIEAQIDLEYFALEDLAKSLKRESRWIRKTALDYYAATLAILKEVKDVTAKQLAAMLDVKPTRVYYWLQRLADFHLVDREQHYPSSADPEPQGTLLESDSVPASREEQAPGEVNPGSGIRAPGRGSPAAGPVPPPQDGQPAKVKHALRRVWHYFRRTPQNESDTQSNEKLKPEDEKT